MAAHPRPFLDFAIGRHVEAPPAWLDEFVHEHSARALKRAAADEIDSFVELAQQTLERVYGVRVSVESILPAPSGRAAMSVLTASLVAPGDQVLVTEPGYPAFARVAAQRGARIRVAALDPARSFAVDLSTLDRSGGSGGIRFAALNYPNNPTGTLISPVELGALRDRLGPEPVIFNDAVYGPLTYRRSPFSMLADEFTAVRDARVLELHSLGKLFALGPLGIAFLVGSEDLIARVRQYSDFAWTQLNSLQVRTAIRCLESWEHVERVRDGFSRRLDRLRSVVAGLGFTPFPTAAGLYLLCRLPAALAGHPVATAGEAADRLLENHDLAVVPWEAPPHGYLRFSAAYPPAELDALAGLGTDSTLAAG